MIGDIKGQVTYVLRDAKTEEIISEHTQENIITEWFYYRLRDTWQFAFNIVTTNAIMEPSRFTHQFPGNGTQSVNTAFPSRVIPALGVYTKYFPTSGSVDQYVQIAGRYDAPAIGSSRTVASVGLGARPSTFYGSPITGPDTDSGYLAHNQGSPAYVMAFLKLTTPCVQTDQQVLDVYYRLFFPHTASSDNISYFYYSKRFIENDWMSSNYGSFPTGSRKFPFKMVKPKADDVAADLSTITQATAKNLDGTADTGSNTSYWNLGARMSNSTTLLGTKTISYTDGAFGDFAGNMIGSVVYFSNTPTYFSNLTRSNKIQNLIGSGDEITNPVAPSFLDVDNLPTGTGKVYLSGSWNNIGTPSSPGLYYPSVISEYNRIKITTSGNIGVSQYKIVRQKFFGYLHRWTTYHINSYYRYTEHLIPTLSTYTHYYNGSTYTPNYDDGKSILEDVSETYFSTPQISSCCRFDDSSFVFVKKNKIVLYSVGASDYWKYSAAYSNIHQVAVMDNKIYVACRSTGLWIIDPYNSLTPVNVTTPIAGIDLSICNGVAKGYGNIIWVVGNNCLASFDGTTWTKYDSTTTPSFIMIGVSDNNWSNIEYIKVDEDSVDNQMLLVRKYNATADASTLGVWWSTTTSATNAGVETAPTGGNMGRVRVHRGHVGGLGGYWIILIQNQWYRMSFGGTIFTSITNASAYTTITYNYSNNSASLLAKLFQSSTFVKNHDGSIRTFHIDSANVFWNNNNADLISGIQQKTIDSSGTIDVTLTSATSGLTLTGYGLTETGGYYYSGGPVYWVPVKTSTFSNYAGGADLAHNFILCPGVMIQINYDSATSSNGRSVGVSTRVMNFGLDYTQGGGAMKYVAQQEYGWDGSQWVLNNPNGKPTHTSAEALVDGVEVRFEEGASGTSFETPNVYKFGLCEGILKDNATRAIYSSTPYYFRKTTSNVTDLEYSTVPIARAGLTGVVGLDPNNKSNNATQNGDSETLFPGQNTRQYAVGDKELVGDFVLSIDVTNLNATDVKNAACVGVTRRDYTNNGMMYFGFICSGGTLYVYDAGSTPSIATITAGSTISLEIRRTSGVLSLWRNGSNVRTMTGTGIRAADYVLDVIFGVWDHRDTTYLPATGTRVPKATITSNGSAIYVNLGNSTSGTGRYSTRFFGIDYVTTGASTFTMDGSSITPKIDGTAPAAGEVTIDHWRGVAYFNSADIGKSISANYLHINS